MTLYASILSLKRNDIQTLRVTDPYSVHRMVYSLFEDVRSAEQKANHTGSGILYFDRGNTPEGRTILMLSSRPPAAHVLTKTGKLVGSTRTKEIPEDFLLHKNYQFKVVVNPTRRDPKSKKLCPIRGYADIEHWFRQRSLNDWGFQVEDLRIDGVDVLRFANKHKHLMTLSHAKIGGRLIIVDPIQFKKSFATGLGRNSAFGCGLLQLVPIKTTI